MTVFKIWWIGYVLCVPYLWWYMGWLARHIEQYNPESDVYRDMTSIIRTPIWPLARGMVAVFLSVIWFACLPPTLGTMAFYYGKRLIWRFSK